MPVRTDTAGERQVLVLEEIVGAEETDEVVVLLREHPGSAVDLSRCAHLHTAVLQALLMLKPDIIALPPDPFWRWCIPQHTTEGTDEDDSAGR